MRQPVGPVRQFLVGTPPAVADQGGMIAKPLVDHPIGQFHSRVQSVGVVEPVQKQIGPGVFGRQIILRKRVRVS